MKKLRDFAPVGMNLKPYFVIFGISILVPLSHFLTYVNRLFDYATFQKQITEFHKTTYEAPYFIELLDGFGLISLFPSIVCLFFPLFFSLHHFRPTKSIYVMKRIPKPWEYHKRIWTLPIFGAIFSIILIAVLTFMLYSAYSHYFIPNTYPENQWNMFWTYYFRDYPGGMY